MAAEQPAASSVPLRSKSASYIATIAIGHGLKHWYIAAFSVFLPFIEKEFALSTFGVALLTTLRQFAGGAPNFFVGYVSDKLRNHWTLLLPISFIAAATSMMLAGLSHWYWPMVFFIGLAGVSAAFWHPPAISMLSARFPRRRGMAIAFHGAGSGAGEALAPLIVGAILTYLLANNWRLYTVIAIAPAIVICVAMYWMLAGAGSNPAPPTQHPAKITDAFTMLRYPVYRSLAYMNFTRSFAHFGVLSFLPLYLADDLGMNALGVGLGVALLTLIGAGVGPALGHFSDQIGRRIPMVAALVVMSLGMLAIGIVGQGILMFVALGFIGIFLWSVQDVTNATAMDNAPQGREGSVVGMMFSSSLLGGIVAPTIMGLAIDAFDGRRAIFFVAAIVVAPAILVMSFAPLTRQPD